MSDSECVKNYNDRFSIQGPSNSLSIISSKRQWDSMQGTSSPTEEFYLEIEAETKTLSLSLYSSGSDTCIP